MSSHREAPAISKDPVADNTDTYAFVSPDDPSTVTIISNYLPLEPPFGGPNFYEFGDDVRYDIHIDNDGDGRPDITYTFQFDTEVPTPTRSSTTPVRSARCRARTGTAGSSTRSCGSPTAGRSCSPSISRARRATSARPRRQTTRRSRGEAVQSIGGGRMVFAGQRLEGFYVDLGAIFDLGDLRPFEKYHVFGSDDSPGVDATHGFGVHSIALKVPKSDLTRSAHDPDRPDLARGCDRRLGLGEPPAEHGPLVRRGDAVAR